MAKRICRIEELEKREYLAADPSIMMGVVYCEQQIETDGDKFYVAWVGGEEGTTLETLVINLDKDGIAENREGEAVFDTEGGTPTGVYSSVPFTLVSKTEEIGYEYEVEDGGQTLVIHFSNFHAGDSFIFTIDLDEVQGSSTDNPMVEGAEMGGSKVRQIDGSWITAEFSSKHFLAEDWKGMFINNYDDERECERYAALDSEYDRELLPYDLDDGNEGIWQAGLYDTIRLTPKPIAISGYIYADYDVDCEYDPEDSPLAGVGVTLVAENGDTWTTKTNDDGYYEFGEELGLMPGKYEVYSEANFTSPEGLTYADFCSKGGEFGDKITPLQIEVKGMQGGDVAPNNNFAKVLPASISGHVFEDLNNANGKEAGENWDGVKYPAQVQLYRVTDDGQKVLMETQTVDKDGYYKFDLDCSYEPSGEWRKLPGKTYEVWEVFSSEDYTDGKDYVGTVGSTPRGQAVLNDKFTEVYIGYGEHGINYDFGELKLGSIAGNVYEDRNDNGVKDPGEGGIAGVTIELYQFTGSKYEKIRETKTDKDGSYCFDGLDIVYDYAVREKQPENYSDGKDALGDVLDGNNDPVRASEGTVAADDYLTDVKIGWDEHGVEYNFGELKLGSIAGNVYEDRNDNGVFEKDDEAGIANVTIDLYWWNGFDYEYLRSTKTDANGAYRFDNLNIEEQYAVKERQPDDYADGKDALGDVLDGNNNVVRASEGTVAADDYLTDVKIGWDEHGVEYNFGELKLGSISGYVYHDENDNGIFEKGDEDPIEGVTVELYRLVDNEYEFVAETTTDAKGFYKFDNLNIEEIYAVKEIQPAGWNDGKDSVGTPCGGRLVPTDTIDSIHVKWDEHGVDYNFGELLPPAKLSGHVYEDVNDNGVKDSGEAGIPNATITLLVRDATTGEYVATGRTTTTDSQGYYEFNNVKPNRFYRLVETQPAGYNDGKDAVGSLGGVIPVSDVISDIPVKPSDDGVNYDFGELKPEDPRKYPPYPHEIPVKVPNNTWGVSPTNFPYIYYQPTIPGSMTTLYGGGGFVDPYTWHLSTLNDAYPKSEEVVGSLAGFRKELGNATMLVDNNFGTVTTVGNSERYVDAEWILRDLDDSATETHYRFGKIGAKPIVGDWNGDGKDYIGIFDSGKWYLDRNGDGVWNVEDILAEMGSSEDQPVSGDWDGDGKTDIGVFGPRWDDDPYLLNVEKGLPSDNKDYVTVSYNDAKNSENSPTRDAELRSPRLSSRRVARQGMAQDRLDLIDHVFKYGAQGDVALTGDWTGDGISKIGVYHKGEWYLDRNGNGVLDDDDEILRGDAVGDDFIPVVGDFDGDGIDTVGYFSNGRWLLDVNGDHQLQEFHLGRDGDKPVTGDWDGDGRDEIGVYRETGDSSAPVETQSTFSYDETDFSSPSAY